MEYFLGRAVELLILYKGFVDRATGLSTVPGDVQLQIEVLQMDTRARLGPPMAIVGEIVLLAMAWGFEKDSDSALFYGFVALVSLSYASLIIASFYWKNSNKKLRIFDRYQRIYCFLQFFLGACWGGVISTALPMSDPVQTGQIYAILIGLVSTSAFSGPAIYSLSFWTPVVGLSIVALIEPRMQTNTATLSGIASYYALTFFSILSVNRKLVEREINALRIAKHKEDTDLLLRDFQEGTSDWLWEVDRDLIIQNPSGRFCAAAGRQTEEMRISLLEILKRSSEAGLSDVDISKSEQIENKLRARSAFRDVTVPVEIAGDLRWWELSARPIIDQGGHFFGFRGVSRDVTEIQRVREKVDFVATHDSLTKLPNRESFGRYIDELCRSTTGAKGALLCIDLDFFKVVNDSFGHATGDSLLIAVCERLRGCIRYPDKAFRIGGDEFAILLSGSDMEKAAVVAQRVVDQLSLPFQINGLRISIGACIGIAYIPEDGRSPEQAHHNADIALYRAKNEGRGTFRFFNAEADGHFESLYALRSQLNNALENHQFFIEYQPIVDLRTNGILSAEALLRWTNPAGCIVEPGTFIPMLEHSGQIAAVGAWVIESAVRVVATVRNDMKIAINLSPLQLADHSLPQKIKHFLMESAVTPDRIEFEVTESSLLDRDAYKLAVLREIKAIGCRISLDDFGTGYSSLRLLNEFPFDKLKIDGSFIRGDANDIRRTQILEAMIELGKKLGLVVIGEGVETQEQANRLARLGCCEGQGFFFHRPMVKDEFLKILAAALN